MLSDPESYSEACNGPNGFCAEEARSLKEHWSRMTWGPSENVLDVGCGPGDSMAHVIVPSLRSDFHRLVGIDISPKMIEFASKRNKDPRLHFQVMDISTKEDPLSFFEKDIQEAGGFHKIISIYTVHFVKDRRQAYANMKSLLLPGGYALVYYIVRVGLFKIWDRLAAGLKWSDYFPAVQLPFNSDVYIDDYERLARLEAEGAGLEVVYSQELYRKDSFTEFVVSEEALSLRCRSVDPLVGYVPDDRKAEYLSDLMAMVKRDIPPRGLKDYTGLLLLLKNPSRVN